MIALPLESSAFIQDALLSIRRPGCNFVTNLFGGYDQVSRWNRQGGVLARVSSDSLILLRKYSGFNRLYFAAYSVDSLVEALSELPRDFIISADLVGKSESLSDFRSAFNAAGFTQKITLERMYRGGSRTEGSIEEGVVTLGVKSAGEVYRILHANFDPVTEQLPAIEELESCSRVGNILAVPDAGDQLLGLLVSEHQGVTSILKHWWVHPLSRNQGIGGRLLRSFLAMNPRAQRHLLWVVQGNDPAISQYRKFGFAPDGTQDWVMVRQASLGAST